MLNVTVKDGKTILSNEIKFKKNGLIIKQVNGFSDLYKYAWLAKHETVITGEVLKRPK